MYLNVPLRQKTLTQEDLVNEDPILLLGQLGVEVSPTGFKLKIGDGVKPWSELQYYLGDNSHEVDLTQILQDIQDLQDDVTEINSNILLIQTEIGTIRTDLTQLEETVITNKQDTDNSLETKVDKEINKGLSSNDFTDDLKAKLEGLESSKYKGQFTSLQELIDNVQNPEPGDYQDVDVQGEDLERYIYDQSDDKFVKLQGQSSQLTSQQVKVLYEQNPDTNQFTDQLKLKLEELQNIIIQQVTGNSETEVMSQDQVTRELSQLESEIDLKLDTKVDKEVNKGLSTNDFSDLLKLKLENIEDEATKTTITQVTGNSETEVMSQKQVTEAIQSIPSPEWGSIAGDIQDQTDLQGQLNALYNDQIKSSNQFFESEIIHDTEYLITEQDNGKTLFFVSDQDIYVDKESNENIHVLLIQAGEGQIVISEPVLSSFDLRGSLTKGSPLSLIYNQEQSLWFLQGERQEVNNPGNPPGNRTMVEGYIGVRSHTDIPDPNYDIQDELEIITTGETYWLKPLEGKLNEMDYNSSCNADIGLVNSNFTFYHYGQGCEQGYEDYLGGDLELVDVVVYKDGIEVFRFSESDPNVYEFGIGNFYIDVMQ